MVALWLQISFDVSTIWSILHQDRNASLVSVFTCIFQLTIYLTTTNYLELQSWVKMINDKRPSPIITPWSGIHPNPSAPLCTVPRQVPLQKLPPIICFLFLIIPETPFHISYATLHIISISVVELWCVLYIVNDVNHRHHCQGCLACMPASMPIFRNDMLMNLICFSFTSFQT